MLPVEPILQEVEKPKKKKPWPKILLDNSRSWHKWESSRDFKTVMASQYKTTFVGQYAIFDTKTGQHVQGTERIPLSDYWAVRLGIPKETQKDTTTMDLLRAQISKDARTSKLVLEERLKAFGFTTDSLRKTRAPEDNLRLALSCKLRPWRKFTVGSMRCEVVSKNTTKEGLDIRIQVCCIDKNSVTHTEDLCVIRESTPDERKAGMPAMLTEGKGDVPPHFRDLLTDLDAADLVSFGDQYYFEGDLRRLVDDLLENACMPPWPGLRLVLTQDASELVKSIAAMLKALDAGSVNLNLLSLDNTPANREALGRELSEKFIEQLEKLEELCGITAPNIKSIQAKFAALQEKIDLVETTLGVELDYLDAAMAVERALEALTA